MTSLMEQSLLNETTTAAAATALARAGVTAMAAATYKNSVQVM